MNERIKELVRQAADYANTYSDAGADVWFEMYNKKFAELIVNECANICFTKWRDNGDSYGYLIKDHFGVEP